jgi:hypothetical protein
MHLPEQTETVAELLPGWHDEWVIFERERIRQRMLHALEELSRVLLNAGRYGEVVAAAMEAVAVEPGVGKISRDRPPGTRCRAEWSVPGLAAQCRSCKPGSSAGIGIGIGNGLVWPFA